MKRIAVILLALLMLVFASCDEKEEGANDEILGTQTDAVQDIVEDIVEESVKKNYPDNILMEDKHYINSSSCVFENEAVLRSDIETVTFKNTLADMPADAWDVSDEKNGSVMAWVIDGVNLYIAGDGGVTAKDCTRLFLYYKNLKSVDFGGAFYTDISESLFEMFAKCESLETLDLSSWNTTNVESFGGMFYDCFHLTSLNLSGWDTSKALSMHGMFDGCIRLENVDVSHFETSKVQSFDSMFSSCYKLGAIDVSSWDTSSAKRMFSMFSGCSILTELDLSGWDTTNVESMYGMFSYCMNLTSVGDLKIPEGCDTTDMFEGTPLA